MNTYNSEIEDIEIESVADLAEQMVFRLNGCTPTLIRKMLQIAFSDFARVSCCFTTEYEFDTEMDELRYPISATLPKMFVDSICAVWLDGRRLESPRQYRTRYSGGVSTVEFDERAFADFCSSDELLKNPTLNERIYEPQKVRVRIIELPKIGSETAPRWFLNKYGEAVVAGALVRLFGMTGKPWSDPVQAQSELIRYENFTTQARIASSSDDGSQCGNGHIDAIDTSGLL